jgi:OOP family OmpA-OmpF porin
MSLKKALLAATVLALPLAAQAQPVSGVYLGAGIGANFLQEMDLDAKGPLATSLGAGRGGKAKFDVGGVGVLSIGYGFGNGVRAEIEGNFRSNEVDKVTFNGRGYSRSGGSVYSYGAMFNALYDFSAGLPVTPYIGAGIGYVWQEFDSARGYNPVSGDRVRIDGDDGQFAFQGIAGLSFNIDAVPGLAVTAEYRFLGTLDPEITATRRNAAGAVLATGKLDTENYNHSLLIGLRYAFGAEPAPAPLVAPAAPAAAPAPARTYLVFFDWDRADLTDRARQIIAEAAQNSSRVAATRIEVSGHADRSGTPQYNQRLSMRRAEAVAAELVRQGVSRGAISVQAFGESRPLVATADGVREPQNRRVEIVLR